MNADDGGNCALSFAVLRSHSNDYEQAGHAKFRPHPGKLCIEA